MKKLTTILILIFLTVGTRAQDTIRINHTNYTTVFDRSKHYPVLVEWWLTKAKISCANPQQRNNTFCPDPKLPNETNLNKYYQGSGYDRGHMCDDRDNLCQGEQVQRECFYYSNMSAQWPSLNRGSWKQLETLTRTMSLKYDSIKIWCGNIGEANRIGIMSVPIKCWKVIYIKRTKEFKAYVFSNSKDDSSNVLDKIKVDVECVQKLTGFQFKP